MKKVQGKIPVVSLLSKLLTPEGGIGVEALSYNEYCRAKLDAADDRASAAESAARRAESERALLHVAEQRAAETAATVTAEKAKLESRGHADDGEGDADVHGHASRRQVDRLAGRLVVACERARGTDEQGSRAAEKEQDQVQQQDQQQQQGE